MKHEMTPLQLVSLYKSSVGTQGRANYKLAMLCALASRALKHLYSMGWTDNDVYYFTTVFIAHLKAHNLPLTPQYIFSKLSYLKQIPTNVCLHTTDTAVNDWIEEEIRRIQSL